MFSPHLYVLVSFDLCVLPYGSSQWAARGHAAQSEPTSSHADWNQMGVQTPGTNTARVKGASAFTC